MTSTEDIFNNAYQCLSEKVSANQQIHDDPKIKRRFARETIADWLSSEYLAHKAYSNPSSSQNIQLSLETTFCSMFSFKDAQSNTCKYKDGRFLFPKEMEEACIGNNTASTYPNYPDRLAIFTENAHLRESMGCPTQQELSTTPPGGFEKLRPITT